MSNSFAAVHHELIAEWSEKNLPMTPDKVTFGSNKKVWWKGACGHEWETSVKARSNGEKCPVCSGARVVIGVNNLRSENNNSNESSSFMPIALPKIKNTLGVFLFLSVAEST